MYLSISNIWFVFKTIHAKIWPMKSFMTGQNKQSFEYLHVDCITSRAIMLSSRNQHMNFEAALIMIKHCGKQYTITTHSFYQSAWDWLYNIYEIDDSNSFSSKFKQQYCPRFVYGEHPQSWQTSQMLEFLRRWDW